jgi:hypothetical protein
MLCLLYPHVREASTGKAEVEVPLEFRGLREKRLLKLRLFWSFVMLTPFTSCSLPFSILWRDRMDVPSQCTIVRTIG